jgi:hypothetical protein
MEAILIGALSVIFPRVAVFGLAVFSTWFTGVFQTWWWPTIAFIFLPHTMLWYSAVVKWYQGVWELPQILVMLLSILLDLGVLSLIGRRKRKK